MAVKIVGFSSSWLVLLASWVFLQPCKFGADAQTSKFFPVGRPNKSRAKALRIEQMFCSLVDELDQTKLGMHWIYVYK